MALTPEQIQAILDRDLPGGYVLVAHQIRGLVAAPPAPLTFDLQNPTLEALNRRFAGRRPPVVPNLDADDDIVVSVRSTDGGRDSTLVVISASGGNVVSVQG